MRWPVRLGLLSSVWAPARDGRSLCPGRHVPAPRCVCGRPGAAPLPDRLKLDWCRFRKGGGWCLEGEDLAEGAGVAYLGVAGTSYTGPSYMPLGTPCSPET